MGIALSTTIERLNTSNLLHNIELSSFFLTWLPEYMHMLNVAQDLVCSLVCPPILEISTNAASVADSGGVETVERRRAFRTFLPAVELRVHLPYFPRLWIWMAVPVLMSWRSVQ